MEWNSGIEGLFLYPLPPYIYVSFCMSFTCLNLPGQVGTASIIIQQSAIRGVSKTPHTHGKKLWVPRKLPFSLGTWARDFYKCR